MTTMSRELCRTLSDEMDAALRVLAAKHGLTVRVNGGSFTADGFRPKVEFMVPGETPGVGAVKRDENAWASMAPLYGLDPAWLGKDFTAMDGDRYRVMGLLPGRSKNVVKVLRLRDNSQRVAPVGFVKAGRF